LVSHRIGILGLQGAVAEHAKALVALDVEPVVVRKPADLALVSGLIFPGGESTTISQLAVDLDLLEPIQHAVSDGLPAFGTCAGMIMLADEVLDGRPDQQQFGGLDITVRRNAFGRQVDSFESALAIKDVLGMKFPGVFIRAPWIERVGDAVEVLATVPAVSSLRGTETSETKTQVVAVRQDNVLATSFHPEITHDNRLHELFLTMVT
jgi:5'-phosphate synthase pdxT subunit